MTHLLKTVAFALWPLTATATSFGPARSEASLKSLPHEREMEALVRLLFEAQGLPNKVPVLIDPQAAKGCAYATTASNSGSQYIAVYLPCTGPLLSNGKYQWRAVGVLAHEVGHLLAGDTTSRNHGPRDEGEADEYAGYQLFRLGATLEEAQTLFRTLDETGGGTHPPRAQRLEAVARGWNRARLAQSSIPAPAPVPHAPVPPPPIQTVENIPPPPVPKKVILPPVIANPKRAPLPKAWWEGLMEKKLPWASGQ